MPFSLPRPLSPSRDMHDDDPLSSTLHAALSTFAPGSSLPSDHHHDSSKEKDRARIDILVDSDCLSLKGSSADIEPALLKGHVVLHLTEPTSVKEITLQFRGKARLPSPSTDALSLNASSSQWYCICNHDWSFLEGERRHSHTLKAGSHHFPFQLQLGGSLPSSLVSPVCGGLHVSYKLRAVAVRPGLAHNMQAVMPISVIRTFAPESLEYQQSLEVENTWPEKLMYSIMIPHKAWAAGDTLAAVVKLSPLAKGIRVLSVSTMINETTKLHCRGGLQEQSRAVAITRHGILDGNVVPAAPRHGFRGSSIPLSSSLPATPGLSSDDRRHSFGSLAALATQDLTLRQVPSAASSTSSHDSPPVHAPPPGPSDPSASSAEPVPSTSTAPAEAPSSQNDVVAQLSLVIPRSLTPSHSLEPIMVSHRIRWSILMSNLDGHTSELRCSLPLHILDFRLLDEARANSAATRRLLLDGSEAPVDQGQDAELPSYSAHVRDRVANMYLPDSATTRVLNPWVHSSNVSPTFLPENQSLSAGSPSGAASPSMPQSASSHLPHVPQSGPSTPLDWVNSELLLSLSNAVPVRPCAHTSPHSYSPSDSTSVPESRPVSRRGSRAPSPERHLTMSSISSMAVSSVATSHETYAHDGHASRTLPGLFSIQMKPHTSLTSPGWLSSRSNSHSSLASLADMGAAHRVQAPGHYGAHGQQAARSGNVPHMASAGTTESMPESVVWHRVFTEVPDYDVASRGFIGGVTPLTSMRGLPSYEEAERSANGGADEGRLTIGRSGSLREQVA